MSRWRKACVMAGAGSGIAESTAGRCALAILLAVSVPDKSRRERDHAATFDSEVLTISNSVFISRGLSCRKTVNMPRGKTVDRVIVSIPID
jgi:hypothetical protein